MTAQGTTKLTDQQKSEILDWYKSKKKAYVIANWVASYATTIILALALIFARTGHENIVNALCTCWFIVFLVNLKRDATESILSRLVGSPKVYRDLYQYKSGEHNYYIVEDFAWGLFKDRIEAGALTVSLDKVAVDRLHELRTKAPYSLLLIDTKDFSIDSIEQDRPCTIKLGKKLIVIKREIEIK